MSYPLMRKATAVWLLDNTTLTFKQIADFCGLHELEVNGIADGEVASGIRGIDPIINNQITKIGNPQNDTIRISTNGAHYNVYNNLAYTRCLNHFVNRYWWNLQWFSLYQNKRIDAICL